MESNRWKPSFYIETDLRKCADQINKPHEDYPVRVNATEETIKKYINLKKKGERKYAITIKECLAIHKDIMSVSGVDNNSNVVYPLKSAGEFREVNVRIGNHFPIDWKYVKSTIDSIFPVMPLKHTSYNNNKTKSEAKHSEGEFEKIKEREQHLIQWYSLFETIHPFQDGNGRVGGVIIAILSYISLGYYLTPKQ